MPDLYHLGLRGHVRGRTFTALPLHLLERGGNTSRSVQETKGDGRLPDHACEFHSCRSIRPRPASTKISALTFGGSQHQGETEHMVQALSKLHKDVEVCIPHPGVITNSTTWWRAALATMFKITNAITFNAGFPNIDRSQLAAAILEQAVRGFEKQMLSNGDLVRLGTAAASK